MKTHQEKKTGTIWKLKSCHLGDVHIFPPSSDVFRRETDFDDAASQNLTVTR